MSDDLVKRLRNDAFGGYCNKRNIKQAADRIKQLEAALAKADELAEAVDAHSNEFDMTVEDALAAYRQAREATR